MFGILLQNAYATEFFSTFSCLYCKDHLKLQHKL